MTLPPQTPITFSLNKPLQTTDSSVVVNNNLKPGDHIFQLVVVDSIQASDPVRAVVRIVEGPIIGHGPGPEGPIVVHGPGPVILPHVPAGGTPLVMAHPTKKKPAAKKAAPKKTAPKKPSTKRTPGKKKPS